MRYAISQHCFQTVHTKCMAQKIQTFGFLEISKLK